MNIDRINGLNKVFQSNKKNPVKQSKAAGQKDSVSLSPEALLNAEAARISEIAKASPDIRHDRVAELKAKIDDPTYYNDEGLLSQLARNISESLGLE